MSRRSLFNRLAAFALMAFAATSAQAQSTIRIAKQFGISYLPLTIMEHRQLFEQHAKRQGLDLKVEWVQLASGAPMNDAILSGNLELASGGVGPRWYFPDTSMSRSSIIWWNAAMK